ncbi:MAG: hypothetical protein KJ971_00980 [Firmicutes bacterium]|nr:hypothetical protein [Bacillota bacterium]
MDKNDKDLRKNIEDLEKLIEQVKNQQKEEKKKQNKENKPPQGNVIRIDLAAKYSTNRIINLIAGFLVNFILIYGLILIFKFAEAKNDYFYILIALLFTLYEELYKEYLLKKQLKIVLYSSGLIFFLLNVLFFYFIDLIVFSSMFSFVDYLYPILFVLLFQVVRVFFKKAYVGAVKISSIRNTNQKK